MKFLNYLQEKYAGVFNYYNNNVTIFCNPDNKEMMELRDDIEGYTDIRFIIDFDKKKVFFWKGTVHLTAYNFLIKNKEIADAGNFTGDEAGNKYFFGLGELEGKKIRYQYSHNLEAKAKEKKRNFPWLKYDLSWLLSYFTDIKFLTLKNMLKEV